MFAVNFKDSFGVLGKGKQREKSSPSSLFLFLSFFTETELIEVVVEGDQSFTGVSEEANSGLLLVSDVLVENVFMLAPDLLCQYLTQPLDLKISSERVSSGILVSEKKLS